MPHEGPPCSNGSSISGASSSHRLSQPWSSRSETAVPSGMNRACCMAPAGWNSSLPARSNRARWSRDESHGMSGTFHACHTTPMLQGIGHGSNTKSAVPSSSRPRRTVVESRGPHLGLVEDVDDPTSVGDDCRPGRSSVGTVVRQLAHAAGRHRLQPQVPVDRGVDHRRAIALQHQHPPPSPRPGRGGG